MATGLVATSAGMAWVMGGGSFFSRPPDWTGYRDLRRASPAWKERRGPRRRVVDVVCLVPDVPTFLAALSTWDRERCFPILIEDDRFTSRFLRAFRPARVVRFPRRVPETTRNSLWQAAVTAVGGTWRHGARASAIRGDAPPPRDLGACPPGAVVSSPASPLLAGAAALAAGRFQPLVRWEPLAGFETRLSLGAARKLATDLDSQVARLFPRYHRLGDDCDFLTLAAAYPYRYEHHGRRAFDDLLARRPEGPRWGYVGRLTGSAAAGVYQAMCSLFLHPEKVLLFNGYTEFDAPGELEPGSWGAYSLRTPARMWGAGREVVLRDGLQADLQGWKELFTGGNRFDLLFINSSGGPDWFNVRGARGKTEDVPESGPAIVYKIHSFSAAAPEDPQTLAGRWLANGAYIYFGAMDEPYLRSFRTPTLVSAMMRDGVPFSAAMRRADALERDTPWRLVYLGDPLYQLRPDRQKRLPDWAPVAGWPERSAR